TSILSDIETIAVTHDTIKALGIDNFTIHFNNRIILNGLLNKIDAVDKKVEILRTIDKLEKIGLDEVKKQLSENVKLNDKQISRLLSFISIKGTNENIIKDLKSNFSGEEKIDEGINKLETTIQSLQEMGITGSKAKINLSITRGLDYYTGIVFETFLNELPSYGSVCSGGRYDNLARLYTKNVLPGVGGSLGIDRLLAALEELNLINESSEYLDLLILNFDESLNKYYLSLANELRKEGIKTEVFPEAKKLQKQFAFADNKGFKLALVIGEKEKEKGAANLRIINTGERIDNIKKEELINTIKKYL
ncbi:MAG: histidine--tRNA ligase, partial [Spirochaetota bacterium]